MSFTSAQAGLQTAQAKLAAVMEGASQADLEAARSSLASAEATIATKTAGNVRATDIALQQEAVRQAELAVQQAQIDLDGNTLLAPFDGVVASVAGQVGESSSSGTASGTNSTSGSNGFITLVDPKEVRVDVTVDETDVAKIAVGKPAMVTFDALPNQPFRGQVVAISPSGSLSQGVVTYPVSINLDTRNQVIPAGLTASATIVIDQKDDTLLVPNRAVRRQGREQVVDVMGADGKPVTRTVRTGVQNDQMVEISEGLQEGDQVVIPSTTTRAPNLSGPGGAVVKPGGPGAAAGRAQVAGRWS